MLGRLADVVQQQCQVKQTWTFQPQKNGAVMLVWRFRRLPDFVQLFQTHQRVLIRRVLMIKLMLYQTRQLAELRNIFAEQIHLVHRAQNRRHFAAPVEDGQKCFAHMRIVQKLPIHQ